MGGSHAFLAPIVGANQAVETIQKATTSESGMLRSVYGDGDVYYDGKNLLR